MLARLSAILALLCLAACASNPAALGITGPQGEATRPHAEVPPSAAGELNPAVNSGRYTPTMGPTTNGGPYWGYN